MAGYLLCRATWRVPLEPPHLPDDIKKRLESCLGSHGPDMIDHWVMDDEFDTNEVADFMPDSPNNWSDGIRVQDPSSGKGLLVLEYSVKQWVLILFFFFFIFLICLFSFFTDVSFHLFFDFSFFKVIYIRAGQR